MKEIEQAHADGVGFACPVIAQNMADGRRSIRWNGAILPILNCERFSSV